MTGTLAVTEAAPARRPRIKAGGRRHAILTAVSTRALTLSQICRTVRRALKEPVRDRSIERIKIRGAVDDLRRDGLVARTPFGWTITVQGLEQKRQAEGRA